MQNIESCVYAYMYTCAIWVHVCIYMLYICMYVCCAAYMLACVRVCICMCMCPCVCIVCLHAWAWVCVCVCAHVCVYMIHVMKLKRSEGKETKRDNAEEKRQVAHVFSYIQNLDLTVFIIHTCVWQETYVREEREGEGREKTRKGNEGDISKV